MTAFHLHRPGSFFNLVLLGFALVSLPLIVALVTAGSFVDRLERQSTGALYRAVAATEGSRSLLEHVTDLERKARQFGVLGDEASRRAYLDEERAARETIRELNTSALPKGVMDRVRTIAEGLDAISAVVQDNERDAARFHRAIDRFAGLNDLAKAIFAESNGLIVQESDALQRTAEKAKTVLAWQTLAVIPSALAFAVFFVLLISRPVRQIDRAIHRLGEGDFASSVAVSGPRDMEFLGKKLDWLRNKLLQLQGEKTRFLARVSHELKTPLTAIREGADLLREELVGGLNDQQKEVAEILCQNSVRLQRSIQGLLDFSVAQAKTATRGARTRFPLRALLDDVLVDHRPAVVKKELRIEVDGSDAFLWGDREQLRVAFDNLVSNAVKFTPIGGRIEVSVDRKDSRATVDLVDSGPGIDASERDRVFMPFYQGKSRGAGAIKGSGLGLSIAREIVGTHGGTIEALDRRDGAHFRVTLLFGREEGDA